MIRILAILTFVTTLHARADERLTFHAAPKPLPEGAVTQDWPRFLGPNHDATSGETKLLKTFPKDGPKIVWEVEKGEGYTCPAIVGDQLVLFHRIDDEEVIECRHRETGKLQWKVAYPVEYRDRYGYSNGPRASPVIDGNRIYTAGVTAKLRCNDLATGKLIWMRDLMTDYGVRNNFFGYGSTPFVWKDRLIVNIGGTKICVAALAKDTGKEIWNLEDEWGASYASPIVKSINGKEVALVFAGGESRPAIGGLLVIDPDKGTRHARFPWRADKYESATASTPIVIGKNRVFISECYALGGALLEFAEDWSFKEVWQERWFGMHWMTPVQKEGYLYGFAGRNEPDVQFKCADAATGEIKWKDDMRWEEQQNGAPQIRSVFRGSLLSVDNSHLCLGEHGTLTWMQLTPEAPPKIEGKASLFLAQHTWTLPALSHGLLYIAQNSRDIGNTKKPRLICYDLRQ
jgi:outer membrane protein assembly factor BamB